MTDQEAHAYHAKNPNIKPEVAAYYNGRNCGEWGGKCEFTEPVLVAGWARGVRSIRAEIRLDNDCEWDA